MIEKVEAKLVMELEEQSFKVKCIDRLNEHLESRVTFYDDMLVNKGSLEIRYKASEDEEPNFEQWDWDDIVQSLETISGIGVKDFEVAVWEPTIIDVRA